MEGSEEKEGALPLAFLEAAAHIGRDDIFDPRADEATQGAQALAVLRARSTFEHARKAHKPTAELLAKLNRKTAGEPRLFELIELYEHDKPAISTRTQKRTRRYLQRFVACVGDMRPAEVTRDHVVRWREALEKEFSTANVQQQLDKLTALFNVALSAGAVTSNPAYKVKARTREKTSEARGKGFSEADMSKLFAALASETEDFRWIVKLLAFHGMRGGEVLQLRVDDVLKMHGVDVFDVHGRHGSIKNTASIRTIPIHPKCKDIVAYAAKVVEERGPEAWLFQSYGWQDRVRQFQNYAGKWIRKTLGDRSARRAHDFRHRFRTVCREVEMPESVSRALMGHTLGGGEHGSYGAPPSLKLRAKWIAKVDPLQG